MPRVLGALESNTSCILYGFGGIEALPERKVVLVLSSEFCDQSASQFFCSQFEFSTEECEAETGSPIICGTGTLDGILIRETITSKICAGFNIFYVLNYHSIGDFREWIDTIVEQYSDAQATIKVSAFLSLTMLTFVLKFNSSF